MATTTTLVMITLLCLLFSSTRLFGLVGLVALIKLYPLFFLVIFALAGIAFYFIHYHKRSNNHDALSKLPDRRDQ